MATTIHTPNRSISATSQMCPSVMSPASDKGDSGGRQESSLHREILDKLKHEAGSAPTPDTQLLTEQLANYHKLRAAAMSDSPMAAEMLRREALFSLQSVRPKLDYFSQLAALQEQQQQLLLQSAQGQRSPGLGRASNSPSGSEDGGEGKLESLSPNHAPSQSAGAQWTYEEQFKQLYELGDEPDRREFLDELFAYMQKRGTPVNRIPIMAKQTLDMYKLFKLVVSKGGLVEVINKKLWREITKGLNLPSSITSAAFTLRTQYMKYIYPFECEKYGFSSPSELQAAIDGNRREGRRPGYGYDLSSPGTLPPFYSPQSFPAANPFFNPMMNNPMANLLSNQINGYMSAGMNAGATLGGAGALGNQMSHPRLTTPRTSTNNSPDAEDRSDSPIDVSSPVPQSNHRSASLQSAFSKPHPSSDYDSAHSPKRQRCDSSPVSEPVSPLRLSEGTHRYASNIQHQEDSIEKRLSPAAEKGGDAVELSPSPPVHVSSTHIKITNAGDSGGEGDKSSVVVSMEVNGVLYQGVLFAKK